MWQTLAGQKDAKGSSRNVHLLLVALICVSPCGASFGKAQDAAEKPAVSANAAKRNQIERAIQQIKAQDTFQAEMFATELAALEANVDKNLEQKSTDPEYHVVSVSQGGILPPGLIEGKERFTLRYAEVQVTRTGRPLVLGLRTSAPIYWKVLPAEGVRIDAVLLDGHAEQRVTGVAEDTWVVPASVMASDSSEWRAQRLGFKDGGRNKVANDARRSGRSLLEVGEYSGEKIVVGPQNPQWRDQYVLSSLNDLEARVTRLQEALAAKKNLTRLKKLTFDAIFHQDFGSKGEYGDRNGSSAYATFTIRGPKEESLRPRKGKLSCIVHDLTEDLTFAIDEHTNLVLVDDVPGDRDPPKIPVDKAMLGSDRFIRMVMDSKRRRLILTMRDGSNKPLAAYDIAKNTWSVLQPKFPAMSCITFVEGLDAIYAVPSDGEADIPGHVSTKPRDTILKLDADGNVVQTIRTSSPMDLGDANLSSSQILYVDDLLVVLGRPHTRPPSKSTGSMYVIDSQTGEILYSGTQELWRETPRPKMEHLATPFPVPVRDRAGRVSVQGVLAALDRIESESARLRAAGEIAKSERWQRDLKTIRLQLTGREATQQSGQPELHVVGFYAAGACKVHVTEKSHPIVLALTAYEPTKWTVTAELGVKLEKVYVSGYHRQKLEKAPIGVPTHVSSHDDKQPYFYIYSLTERESPHHLATLRKATGMDLSTFLGREAYQTQDVTIGPENSAWRMQRVARRLESLTAELDIQRRTEALNSLEALTFSDVYIDPGGTRDDRDGATQMATYKLRGPIQDSIRSVPTSRRGEPLRDPADGSWYISRGNDELVRIPPGGGEDAIAFSADLPRLSWPHGVTFDTKRRRVLLNSFGGGGHVYAYDVVAKTWSVLRTPGLGISVLTYSEQDDVLYVFNNEGGDSISTYTPYGARIDFAKLAADVTESTGRGQPGNPTRIKALGPYVALILPGSTSEDGRRRKLTRIAVADPRSGDILYRGVMRPQAADRKVTDEELSGWWKALLTSEKAATEALLWNIAAGRDRAVVFMAERVGKIAPPEAAEIDKLIGQLDSADFEVRQQAFRRLASFGATAEEKIKGALESPSAEARARAKDLLDALAKDEPATDEQRREFHAIEALGRIGTPAAVAALSRIAERRPPDSLARRAAKAIDNLNRGEEIVLPAEDSKESPPRGRRSDRAPRPL